MNRVLRFSSFVFFLLILSFGLGRVFINALDYLDRENSLYQLDVIVKFLPFFDPVAIFLFWAGIGLTGWIWFRTSNLLSRLLRATPILIFCFSTVSYFNPSIILGSAVFPGWFLLLGTIGHMGPTDYSGGFSAQAFSRVKKNQSIEEVYKLVGQPMHKRKLDDGQVLLFYSCPNEFSHGDYWMATVKVDHRGRVVRRGLRYYFD